MSGLPAEAQGIVSRIEALIAQAEPFLGAAGDEAGFALRETERRYLPDTLRMYLDLPPANRDAAATSMLIDQLRILERSTAQRLSTLAETSRTALAANGAFLTERFGALDTLPEAPMLETGAAPPTVLVRRLFERIERDGPAELDALLDRAGAQISAAFANLTTVRRRGLFGNGPIVAVTVEVPRPSDALRYAIVKTNNGSIEASVARIVRGVALRTERTGLAEWMQALTEDLAAYVERDRSARDVLTRIFGR